MTPSTHLLVALGFFFLGVPPPLPPDGRSAGVGLSALMASFSPWNAALFHGLKEAIPLLSLTRYRLGSNPAQLRSRSATKSSSVGMGHSMPKAGSSKRNPLSAWGW